VVGDEDVREAAVLHAHAGGAGRRHILARALQAQQADDGLASALRRVRAELRVASESRAAPDATPLAPSRPRDGDDAKQLFAALLGDGDRTALLLDRDGLVIAGTYVDGSGREVADEIGAHLSGLADEASRALRHLGLGQWNSLMVEAQHATVALSPTMDGAVVLVAAARDTQVGFVRRLLAQAARKAGAWMGRAA
jgi:predicted regulator of Ras-like GTPase activity (Roadblock/LC7/MglB family)